MIPFSATGSKRLVYTFLMCCIATVQPYAQTVILPAFSKLPDAVQNVAYPAPYTGKPYPLRFSMSDGSTPSSWNWTPTDGTADISTIGIDINPTNGALEYTVAGSPRINAGAAGTLCRGRVEALNNMGVVIAQRNYHLFVRAGAPVLCTAPKEYVLLLDRSGSMNLDDGDGNTRFEELKNTIYAYLPELKRALTAEGAATGTLKVYYFNGAAASLKHSGNWGEDWGSRTFIENTLFREGAPLTDIVPSGGTPMGDAICDAVHASTATSNRTFILFTDGIQTVPPDYNQTTFNIPCTSGGAINMGSNPHNQIKLFTIGTGSCDVSLLQELAHPNDQFAQASVAGNAELYTFFTSTIPWSLYDCGSPRLLDIREGVMNGLNDTISAVFKVNRMVDNLTIRVATLGRSDNLYIPTLQLYKDGELTSYQPVFDALTIRYLIDFDDPFEAGGTWELRFMGPEGAPYQLSVMAEDKYIKTRLSAGQEGLVYAGDPIQVKVSVQEAGAGVNTATVRAILLRPGEDLGDLAARTDVSAGSLAGSVNSDPVEIGRAKIDSLLRTQAFADLVRNDTSGNVLTLNSIGNGEYTGAFTGNEMTGTYRVVALIDGQLTGLGDYQGWETKCVLVDFSRPEDITLQEKITSLGVKDGQQSYRISITPVNKFGKRLGPGQTRRIGIQASQGMVQRLGDQLDGTYSTILYVPEGANPVITITVTDPNKPVLQKSLDAITGGSSAHPFGISLHLGVAVPTGALSTPFDPGIALEGDLTYRLSSQFALEAVAGYYAFQPDFNIVGGTLGAMYIQSLGGGKSVHLAAGAGAFKPKNEDAAFGYSFRVGLNKQISTHLLASLDFGLTGLPVPEYNFVKGTLGLKYFF